jgi:predicted anti-sigma-YlaC factor YlaD
MSFGTCSREKEVTDLFKRGQWPALASPELHAHVASCRACRDLIAVTQAFNHERAHAAVEAQLESPGVIWWRAQLRRRNAALRQVRRPLLAAQIFAVVPALIAAIVYLAIHARAGAGWLSLITDMPAALHVESLLPPSWQSAQNAWLVLLLIAALALAGGIFVYKASEER